MPKREFFIPARWKILFDSTSAHLISAKKPFSGWASSTTGMVEIWTGPQPEVQQTGCPLQLRSHIQMCSLQMKKKRIFKSFGICVPIFPALTVHFKRRWYIHLYKYIQYTVYIYMPLFFDSNWTFKCTTTINPTRCFADHATIFASQMRHTTRDARTKDLDESRAEKGGEAAASFTKCQGEFVFFGRKCHWLELFWWWKRCENAAAFWSFVRNFAYDQLWQRDDGLVGS